jgi:hypothetical protein
LRTTPLYLPLESLRNWFVCSPIQKISVADVGGWGYSHTSSAVPRTKQGSIVSEASPPA